MQNIISFLLMFYSLVSFSQNPDYQYFNFTIQDGLPSNECYDLLQDSLGYVWIATDRGLSRYDGYGFDNFGSDEGLQDISCLTMEFDKNENIYIFTYNSGLYVYDKKLDTVRIFINQKQLIESNVKKVSKIYIDSLNNCYFSTLGHGFVRISNNGEIIYNNNEYDYPHLFIKQIENKVFTTIKRTYSEKDSFHVLFNDVLIDKGVFKKDNKQNWYGTSYLLEDTTVIVSANMELYFLQNKEVNFRRNEGSLFDLVQTNDGTIYTVQGVGAKSYKSLQHFRKNQFEPLIENIYCTSVISDLDNNIWISTLSNGIYFLKRNRFKHTLFLTNGNSSITSFSLRNDSSFYVLEDKKRIWKGFVDSDKNELWFKDDNNLVNDLFFKKDDNCLIVNGGVSRVLNDTIKSINNIPNGKGTEFFTKKIDDDDFLIQTGSSGFVVYRKKLKNVFYEKTFMGYKIYDVLFRNKEDYFIATNYGVKHVLMDSIIELTEISNLLDKRVNSITESHEYIIGGSLGNGLIFWKNESLVYNLTEKQGLISNNIEKLFVSKNNKLFVMTKQGLSIVDLDDKDFSLINLTVNQGLPSNSIVDVEENSKGDVFVVTDQGIVVLPFDYKAIYHAKAPHPLSIKVSGILRRDSIFKYYENDIEIEFRSIDVKYNGRINYQYKLNTGKWINSNQTKISFSSLSPDSYVLEIQSQISKGRWSDSTYVFFKVLPPWWKTWWFYLGLFFIILSLVIIILKIRTASIHSHYEIQQNINNLEKAALSAQMNPHFIFNSLNSIQNFILENDKLQAMEYLAQFAKLIRQSLDASVQSKVSINDEFEMLKHYLSLEKLRFKEKFNYQIEVDKSINKDSIYIPPLLVQPYVENAIIHGMKGMDEKGLIEIIFKQVGDEIVVKIKDNGKGMRIDPNSKQKSLGMKITNERLAHNNKNNPKYKVEIISNEKGTLINVYIKPIE